MAHTATLLQRYKNGDASALDELFELLYPEIRKIARRVAQDRGGEPNTDLVGRAYEYLKQRGDNASDLDFACRSAFLGYVGDLINSRFQDRIRKEKRPAGYLGRAELPENFELSDADVSDITREFSDALNDLDALRQAAQEARDAGQKFGYEDYGLAVPIPSVMTKRIYDCLQRLEKLSKRQADVFRCRYFEAMSREETADKLGIHKSSVDQAWNPAKAYLARCLKENG